MNAALEVGYGLSEWTTLSSTALFLGPIKLFIKVYECLLLFKEPLAHHDQMADVPNGCTVWIILMGQDSELKN
jgi:hypothetical protein